jgi:hypothetical protein
LRLFLAGAKLTQRWRGGPNNSALRAATTRRIAHFVCFPGNEAQKNSCAASFDCAQDKLSGARSFVSFPSRLLSQ